MLKIAILCSRHAPGLDGLLRHPERGTLFDVDCAVTTEESPSSAASRHLLPSPGEGTSTPGGSALARVSGRGWPEGPGEGLTVIPHPIRSFYRSYGRKLSDMSLRRHYDAATAMLLAPRRIDVVVLLGYLYLITDPLLNAFPDRILNVHDSDLPKYPGLHATRDAIIAGEKETRSSVHIVTRELDAGPVLVRSEPFPIPPEASSSKHRQWMMGSWGDLVVDGLKALTAAHRVVA